VSEPLARLERNGFEIIKLSTRGGVIDMDEYREALGKGAFMVSVMMVNNETGAYYDVANMFSLARRLCPDAILHCDATQGYMKVNFNLMRLGADMVTVSAHKIHGPKGVGVLCVAPSIIKQKKLVPIIRGGGQEDGFRSGTENMIGIAGFGGAASEIADGRTEKIARITVLRDYAEKLLENIPEIRINRPSGSRAPHIINLTLPSIKSETMVHFLSSKGISVSGGSACSSHNEKASAALLGFGISQKDAVCSLRISLCDTNTEAEADELATALEEGVKTLVRVK
jgi:cysteine desulfurase